MAVTGASSGIGLELVKALAVENAIVFAAVRDNNGLKIPELAELVINKKNVHLITLHAADNEGAIQAVNAVREIAEKVDVIIANAGKQMNVFIVKRKEKRYVSFTQAPRRRTCLHPKFRAIHLFHASRSTLSGR